MSAPSISVIICTYNPRADYLARTLDGLKAQTLPKSEWEFLLIDNNSKEPLAGRVDLAWHPQGRVVREEKLGLTHARIRGFVEARAPLIIYVDDDNILAPDYVATARAIAEKHPFLGAFGGTIVPEFEAQPAPELEFFLPALALRTVHERRWTNFDGAYEPFGAGMCLRRECMQAFLDWAKEQPALLGLDRTGKSLISCGDNAIARSAKRVGLGWGLFPELKLVHLISAGRVKRDYLERLVEGIVASSHLLLALEYGPNCTPKQSRKREIFHRFVNVLEMQLSSPAIRLLKRAEKRGDKTGRELVAKIFPSK